MRDPECRASNDGRVATGKITPARALGAERLVGSRGGVGVAKDPGTGGLIWRGWVLHA